MRRVTADAKRARTLTSVTMIILTAGLLAQGPNLSGKWTPDTEKNATIAQGERAAASVMRPMTLKQTATSFTIERVDSTGTNSLTYDFGKPIDVDSTMGKATASAKVLDNGVAIATVPIGATTGRIVAYTMEGKWLLVSTTLPGKDGGAPTTTKAYFKKG